MRRTVDGTTVEQRLSRAEVDLIWIESLQWCANNAVYFLGLIGAATYDLAGGAFLVAAVTLVRNLCVSAGNALAGPAIDRVGPRRVAMATVAVAAVSSLVMGMVPISVPSLVFAAVFLGFCGGFLNTTTHAYPGYLQPDEHGRQRLNGLLVLYSNIAFTVGPVAGGLLVGVLPTNSVYLFMAAVMAVTFLFARNCRERVRPAGDGDAPVGVVSGMVEGARITFSNRDLLVIFVSGFLGFFAFGAFDSLESLFYRDVLRVDIVWLGWLSAVVGLTSSLGAWVLTRVPTSRVDLGLLLGSLFAVGVGSMVYVGTDVLWVAILGQAVNGFAWGFLEPVQMTLVQQEAPIASLGRVMGFVRFGLMSAGVLPLLAAPFLADAFGVQPVLFGASCIIAAVGAAFCLWWHLRRKRV